MNFSGLIMGMDWRLELLIMNSRISLGPVRARPEITITSYKLINFSGPSMGVTRDLHRFISLSGPSKGVDWRLEFLSVNS